MKKKILTFLLLSITLLVVTGCNNSKNNIEENKEISISGAYIIDYDNKHYLGDYSGDKAKLIVVFNIKPNKELLLEKDSHSLSLKVANQTIKGEKYSWSNEIFYDNTIKDNVIEGGTSYKIAYEFEMEKYLYKENDTFNIDYNIGKQKGEYSYIINGFEKINKKNIKEVEYLEDIVKNTYKDNAEDALMILSLKWKINEVYERYKTYKSMNAASQIKSQCYYNGTTSNGKKLLNYFTEGKENNISISNGGFLSRQREEPEVKYDLPPLDYDLLEKYYPGIKTQLIELDRVTNENANNLINVQEGNCLPGSVFSNIEEVAVSVRNLLNAE